MAQRAGRTRRSGKAAVLGYNYVQSPAIRHIRQLLDGKERSIGSG